MRSNLGTLRGLTPTAMASRPIGIFDSGVGGLTVLRHLVRQLPGESLLYFGDTARLPYGERQAKELQAFAREILTWMAAQQVKMVLVACNTCSAWAIEALREEFAFPILGTILPGAKAAVATGRRIGVIATPATALSDVYRQAILEIDGRARVWQVGCPEFVPLVEQNRIDDPYTRRLAEQYLAPLQRENIDTLVYGCTHYPYLAPVLRSLLGGVKFVDPAVHLVAAAECELELLGWKRTGNSGGVRFGVSGDTADFARKANRLLGYTPQVERVVLPALTTAIDTRIEADGVEVMSVLSSDE